MLREYHGLSIELAGTLFTGYFAAVTVSQPISGSLSDRLGRDIVTIGALLTGIIGFVLLAAYQALVVIGVGVGLIGLSMGWGPPVQSRVMDRLDADERGTGFGLIRTVYIGFAALNGIVVTGLVTTSGWNAGIGALVVSLVVPAVALGLNGVTGWGL